MSNLYTSRALVAAIARTSALLVLVGAGAAQATTLEEIKTCVAANYPAKTLRQSQTLVVADRSGSERKLELDFEWKRFDGDRSKFVTRVTSPPDMRGSAVLVIENKDRPNDVFSYLPELGKTRRLTSHALSGSAFSSDFTQEDLLYVRSLLSAENQKLLTGSQVEDRPVHVIEAQGQTDSAYEKVVTSVDVERCVLVRAEMHGNTGKLVKVISADPAKVEARGEAFEVMEIRADDPVRGTHSVMRVEDSERDVPIRDVIFTRGALERRGR